MNIEDRLNYYIKYWKNKIIIKIPDNAKTFKLNELIYYTGPNTPPPDNFKYEYGSWDDVFWWQQGKLSIDIPCLAISSDGMDNQKLPAFTGTRRIDDPYGGILFPAAWGYGWSEVYTDNFRNIRNKIKWEDKINKVIWRGSPSGQQDNNNLRIKFCELYKDTHNVGITITWDRWDTKYLKEKLTKLEMLNYKYQISFEGNCGASDLIWKLQCNSLVIMKKPTVESWTMEGLLVPYVHYIPIKDDLSDLDEIIKWCENNDDKCLEIVKNANNFMKKFENIENEVIIFNMIKYHYKNTFTLEL